MQYRRIYVSGGTYFFTVNLLERHKSLLVEHVDLLKQSIRTVKTDHPFEIDAMVVMPEHLHAVWTLPDGDIDFSTRWRLIKANFSRGLPKIEQINTSRQIKGERGIWQRRFWEHLIRDDNDYARHVDYIHFNPVKHGYVDKAVDWPHSSIHKFIQDGVVSKNWGVTDDFDLAGFGEKI